MNRFLRLVKRKKHRRQYIAAAFVIIAFIEMGSHAYTDSHDPAALAALTVCRVEQRTSPVADCPENQKQRQEKNIMDEMTSHTVLLSGLTLPIRWSTYDTSIVKRAVVHSLFGVLSLPFQPPEQA
jgi:hypothetical protein